MKKLNNRLIHMNRITKSNSWIQSCSCKSFMYISQKTSQGREDGKARLSSWRIGQLLNPKLQWQKEFLTQDYCMHHWMTHIVINFGTYSPKNSDENMIRVTKNEALQFPECECKQLWKHGAIWKEAKLTQVLELLSHQLVNEFLELANDSQYGPHDPWCCTFEKKISWVFWLESKL